MLLCPMCITELEPRIVMIRVAAFDIATVSGCDQLVVDPTHARGGTLGGKSSIGVP